ncbi:MAG TPA: hydroxyacid dehydrogenase [Noviherbaspirillum sp.]|nr:hydroxyacid dehydrogenase [Noviherbaspirillum sp.]
MSASAPSRPVILVTGADLAPQAVEILEKFELVYAGKTPDEDGLVELCARHQPVAILVRYGKISARVMDASKKLRVISKHGSGIDTIDSAAAAERGIAVKAAAGANAVAVAEHAWALIFACAKDVVKLNTRMHGGHWDKATHKSLELCGKTLGLIGMGAIGRKTAEVGVALGMKVLAFDPYASAVPEGVIMEELDTVMREAHVLSLHCPLTESNRNMISRDAIGKMRDGAILVNTARGGLVDEEAVLEALQSGKLRAAGLDSFQREPLVGGHLFTNVDNAILSPHIGGVTADAYIGMGCGAARNILAVLNGEI